MIIRILVSLKFIGIVYILMKITGKKFAKAFWTISIIIVVLSMIVFTIAPLF